MKTIRLFIYALCLFVTLPSCLMTRHTNLLQESKHYNEGINEEEALSEYRICSGDELRISVMSLNPETNALFSIFSPNNMQNSNTQGQGGSNLSAFPVYLDGTIDFPYLGQIYVKGKTTLEIKLLMEEEMKLLSKDCAVNVSLNNRYFSVIGESSVGRYPIAKEKTTIYQALAQARDIRPYGDRNQVKLIRQTEAGTIVKVFDVQSQDVINSEFYYIQPNDVIYIQPMGRQFWGVNSFGAIFAVVSTVLSFGLMIYNHVK